MGWEIGLKFWYAPGRSTRRAERKNRQRRPFKNCTSPGTGLGRCVVAKGRSSKKPDNGTKFKETIHRSRRTKAIGRHDTPTLSTSPSIIGRNFVTFVFKRIFFTNVEFPSFVRANFSRTEIERIVVSPFFIYLNHCSSFCSKTKMLDFFTWHRIKEDALRLILCSCDLCNYVCSRCETDRGLGSSLTGIEWK